MLSAIGGWKLRSSWKKLRWQAPSDIDMIARHYLYAQERLPAACKAPVKGGGLITGPC